MPKCTRCIQSKLANPRDAIPGSPRCRPCEDYYRRWSAKRKAHRAARRKVKRTAAQKLSGRGYAGRVRPFAGIDRRTLAGRRP